MSFFSLRMNDIFLLLLFALLEGCAFGLYLDSSRQPSLAWYISFTNIDAARLVLERHLFLHYISHKFHQLVSPSSR